MSSNPQTVRQIALLGATGSIGQSTLKVLRLHPDKYQLFGVSAHRNLAELARICLEFKPHIAVVADAAAAISLRAMLPGKTPDILHGAHSLSALARAAEVDTVVAAIVGAAGLPSTLAAANAGKRILLANKESLVIAGDLVTQAARKSGACILPVDSEHNALLQCLPPAPASDGASTVHSIAGVAKLWLTASGGPFRNLTVDQLASVTPAQACAHPNWQMGRKISVDSATLMNKGLEVIEAFWLFGLPPDRIEVVVHPQSIVHSLVEYIDGSFIAQLGSPDMCTPIAYALAYPERINAGVKQLNLRELGALTFEAPDHARFPCLKLAFDALTAGKSAPVVLNAANEVAVEGFLNGILAFNAIPALINECLQQSPIQSTHNLDDILSVDSQSRALAQTLMKTHGSYNFEETSLRNLSASGGSLR